MDTGFATTSPSFLVPPIELRDPPPVLPRIEIDAESCIGCAGCNAAATRTFTINQDLVAELTGYVDSLEDLIAAVDACPVYAIALYDREGLRLYPQD